MEYLYRCHAVTLHAKTSEKRADIRPIKKNAEVDAKRGTNSWLLLEHCRDRVPFTDLREEDVSHGFFICIEVISFS